MIYFDNAATTFPKPQSVLSAAAEAARLGGNPGRGGHRISVRAGEAVYAVREKAARMFGAEPENVIFTHNCTHGLNMAIKGAARPDTSVVISSLEHNSVSRPVHALRARGVKSIVIDASGSDDEIVSRFDEHITGNTSAVICTAASNVTGRIMPVRRIGEICRRKGVCFIVDGAQACGIIPLKLSEDSISILCMPGHKGLYGLSGTGMLITDGRYRLSTIIEGGTGSASLELSQPLMLPDRLESGTLNTTGIASLGAGMEYVEKIGTERIYAHETTLCERFIRLVADADNVRVCRGEGVYAPIVLFNIGDIPSETVCAALDEAGFALRGGLHCSGLAHKTIGTLPNGGVRFSPSVFNSMSETERLAETVRGIAEKAKLYSQ